MLTAVKEHWLDYLLEAAGLFAFMIGAGLFTTLFLYPGSPVNQAVPSPFLQHVGLGLCMGAVTFGIVLAIGGRTGAHINPAVTWAFWRQGRIGGWDAIFYTLAQFAGALLAPPVLLALIGAPFTDEKVMYATTRPTGGIAAAFVAEFAISFILMLAVLAVLGSRRLERWMPLLTAALIAIYIMLVAPISGMSLNPARSFGSAVTAGFYPGLWIYFAAPLLAMLLATGAYRLLLARGLVGEGASMPSGRRRWIADYQPGPSYPTSRKTSRKAKELAYD